MAVGPADLRTLSRLLDEALALAPSERGAWLAGLVGRDAVHRDTLEQLLAEADRPDERFLTRPGLGHLRGVAPDPVPERAGMRVGPYRLERQIGSGGMGSVWLAQRVDGGLERAVALKLPHVTWVPALNARLARERDILARLAHPNIARLYDAGTDGQGRPYLALEYVEGLPIDEYLQQHSLELRERLVLFKQVAGAVAYAHRHLVVHRDLKPSNVLVSADGIAHLLDFGIAKLLSDDADGMTQITRAAGRMLTPGYASPEQVRGEPVTVASDVYSLGVLLYEMLTGTRPFHATGSSMTELEAAATLELVPLASTRVATKPTQRALRGDLDTILAKALRKEPEARYRTVDALVDDVDRHLKGEPVLARPDSGWYRASRFISRHRDYVALASAALIAVLVGMGVAVEQAQRARVEAQRAHAQAQRADEIRDFVIGLFDLNHSDDPNKLEWRQFTAHELIERGAHRIAVRYDRQPERRAEMLGIAGTIFADIGDPKDAAEMAKGQLAALDTSPANWHDRVAALRVLARAQVQQMQDDLAEATLHRAIREVGSNRGQEAADVHTTLAHLQIVRGEYAAAAEQLNRAESLLDADADLRSQSYASILRERSFLLLWDRKDPPSARATFERARRLTENLTGPLSAESIALKNLFANYLVQYGDVGHGRALFDELLSDIRRASGDGDLEAVSLELDMVFRMNDLRVLPDDGIGRLEKIAASLDQRGSSVPGPLRVRADLVTGAAYTQHGDIQRAEPLMKRAYQLLSVSPLDVDVAPVYSTKYVAMAFYAIWADEAGQHDVSTALWDEIYRARNESLGTAGARNDAVIDPELDAIRSRIMRGDLPGAAERLARVKQQLTGRPNIVSIHWDPGVEAIALEVLLNIESGKLAEAKRVIGQLARSMTPEREKDLLIYTLWPVGLDALRAVVDCGTGQARGGLDALTSLIRANEERLSPNSPTIAYLRSQAGLCALHTGEPAHARDLQASARRAFAAQPTVSAFYKRPLIQLERELASRQLASR